VSSSINIPNIDDITHIKFISPTRLLICDRYEGLSSWGLLNENEWICTGSGITGLITWVGSIGERSSFPDNTGCIGVGYADGRLEVRDR